MGKRKYDWVAMQKAYDEGLSWTDLSEKYGVSKFAIQSAQRRGEFKSRTRAEGVRLAKISRPLKHSEETKRKLSVYMTQYLRDNPDRVPYLLGHASKGKSKLEIIFENAMVEAGITGYVYNHRNHQYQYDFAFLDRKIDVEIDGRMHTSSEHQGHDQKRDEWSANQGWAVVRFSEKEIKTNVGACIDTLRHVLDMPELYRPQEIKITGDISVVTDQRQTALLITTYNTKRGWAERIRFPLTPDETKALAITLSDDV